MKTVAHLTSVHPADDVRIFHKECLSLKKQGFEVLLIAPADQDAIKAGIKILAVSKTHSRLQRMTKVLWQVYRKALSVKADLYHFHDPELILVGLLLRLHGKRVIYDVHEDVPRDILLKTWIPKSLRKIIALFAEGIEGLAGAVFQGIVTVTPAIQKRFQKFHAVEVRNYPVLEEFERSNLQGNFLCYTGLLNEQRGVQEMLQIAQQTRLKIHLAGACYSPSILQDLKQSDFVIHHGHVSRSMIQTIYQQSFVGLALLHSGPTFNESLPIKLFEYMAAGLPIIASNFPLWKDIVERHQCGFCINPHDVEKITEVILYLRNNFEEARQMGLRGRQAVERYYNWQTQETQLQTFYQTILSNG